MTEQQINYFNSLTPFKDISDIPDIPVFTSDEEYQVVVSNLIRCGAIPKDKLDKDASYKGKCRNSDIAIWNGEKFKYARKKFGHTYTECINDFEDYTDYDVFVPFEKIK